MSATSELEALRAQIKASGPCPDCGHPRRTPEQAELTKDLSCECATIEAERTPAPTVREETRVEYAVRSRDDLHIVWETRSLSDAKEVVRINPHLPLEAVYRTVVTTTDWQPTTRTERTHTQSEGNDGAI